MSTVHVGSIDALEQLQTGLVRYADQVETTLTAVQREVQRTLDWLDERVRHWQNTMARYQEEERRTRAAYERCMASGDREHPPNCGGLAEAMSETRRRLAQAEADLRMAAEARKAVQAEVESYQREAGRLRAFVQSDTAKAVGTLRQKAAQLRGYAAVRVPTTGVATDGSPANPVDDWPGIAWLWGMTLATAPLARLSDRFHGSHQELETFYETALLQLTDTRAGAALARALPTGMSIRDVIERDMHRDHIDELSYVAGMAAIGDPDLSAALIGTLVHRIAELRTIYRHPDEVLNGTRFAEQPIVIGKNEARAEIDDIIKRGDTYDLRDYKPINLAKYAETPEGAQWKGYMEQRLGGNFSELMAQGRNPFIDDMPKDIRLNLRSWIKHAKQQHELQLSVYKEAFLAAHGDVRPEQVRTHVRPYFVYRISREE